MQGSKLAKNDSEETASQKLYTALYLLARIQSRTKAICACSQWTRKKRTSRSRPLKTASILL